MTTPKIKLEEQGWTRAKPGDEVTLLANGYEENGRVKAGMRGIVRPPVEPTDRLAEIYLPDVGPGIQLSFYEDEFVIDWEWLEDAETTATPVDLAEGDVNG